MGKTFRICNKFVVSSCVKYMYIGTSIFVTSMYLAVRVYVIQSCMYICGCVCTQIKQLTDEYNKLTQEHIEKLRNRKRKRKERAEKEAAAAAEKSELNFLT